MNKHLSLVLVLFMLFGCVSTPDAVPGDYVFLTPGHTIEKPVTWAEMKNMNKNSIYNMGNSKTEGYCIITRETATELNRVLSSDEYSELTRGNIRLNSESYSENRLSSLDSSWENSVYEIRARIKEHDIVYLHVSVKVEESYFQMAFWSTEKAYKENKNQFLKIAASLNTSVL